MTPCPEGNLGPRTFRLKVCLVGDEAVGKTSLVRRFVTSMFDESYIRTLGAGVSKKPIEFTDVGTRPVRVNMVVLDIMGERTFMRLFQEAYFNGARGILAVFDVTRPESVSGLIPWIDAVRNTVGSIPVSILGNKVDLEDRRRVDGEQAEVLLGGYSGPILYTSAKTGENVDEAFIRLARTIVAPLAQETSVVLGDRTLPDGRQDGDRIPDPLGGSETEPESRAEGRPASSQDLIRTDATSMSPRLRPEGFRIIPESVRAHLLSEGLGVEVPSLRRDRAPESAGVGGTRPRRSPRKRSRLAFFDGRVQTRKGIRRVVRPLERAGPYGTLTSRGR